MILSFFGKLYFASALTEGRDTVRERFAGGDQEMPIELEILALGALLLFVHIFVAIRFKTQQ